MEIKQHFIAFKENVLPAVLNSYSVVFFLNNKLFAIGMLLISFFNFYAGLSGLLAVIAAVLIVNTMGFDKEQLRKGLFSFNALLIGLGMGTFFDPGIVYFFLLFLATLLTLVLSVTFSGWLGKYGLPYLSIPFVLSFWLILLPSSTFENLGLTQRNIYWINEAYDIGGSQLVNFLQAINELSINDLADTYLRSLSSIFFQNNLLSGLLISVLLLISSRIAFSLSIIGFLSAYLFATFTGSATAGFSYYNIGANYIMIALAIGGFFVIPSIKSYLWTFLLVPITALVLLFLTKLFGAVQLPVFSLPFSLVVVFFIYFLMMRKTSKGLILNPIQHYSPESNLYSYANSKTRLSHLLYYPIHIPFWGDWMVSQGHDGKFTHKGDWSNAFDFMLLDDEKKSYSSNGMHFENYYCYNKPVLAPADGIVEEIIDQIEDNEIGKTDTVNNWGNTITIRHLQGLYTQLSHLKKGSFKVTKGDFVKCGDILANCGNSGRSPQPHIHFQVQATPKPGSKTIDYPIAYYLKTINNETVLSSFTKPIEGEIISAVKSCSLLKKAFDLSPNTSFVFCYKDEKGDECFEKWEAFTDAYNYNYLYCDSTKSTAYYFNDGTMFYFTKFYGNRKSLLYYFYLTSFKVLLGYYQNLEISDILPLNTLPNNNRMIWLHDFIAPFINRVKANFSMRQTGSDDASNPQSLTLVSKIELSVFGKVRLESEGTILLKNNRIVKFTFRNKNANIEATCTNL
jgi:urea transporter/murein DD-endopeptidase MepM/ murein hydrolase activator NlpD